MTNDDSRAASAGAADATTVAAYLAGDRSALATIWDRYGETLYDTAAAMTGNREDAADMVQDVFVLAAEKLGQLRDPTRLKPWLFAILRNEVYRRSRRRSKSVVTDFSEAGGEVMLPATPSETDAVEDAAEFDDLAELLRGAARGLDSRDQLVLELTMRQDLSGNDLADALGVTPQQSYGLVHRMRERTERSLGAYCVARRGRKECEELASILSDWDGEFSVLVRKRVARHVDACSTCERTRRRFAPLALIGAAPAFAAPPGLRDRVLDLLGASGAGTSTGDGSTELDSTQLDSSQFESTQFESAQSTHLSSSQRGGVARARFDSAGFPKGLSIVQRLGAATVAGVAASALIVVGGVTVIGIDDGPPELPPIVVEADGSDEGAIVLTSDTTTTAPPEAVAGEQVSVTTIEPLTIESTTSEPVVVETTAVPTTVAVTVAPTTPPTTPPTAPPTTTPPTTPPTTTTVAPTTTTTTAPKTAPSITVRQLPCVDTGQSTFTAVTVTVDVSESDGDTVTVRGTYTYFDGGSTATLVPVSGGTISGDSILITGSGAVTFTLTLSNDNYDDTVEVAVNATDAEGTDYDWMTFLTEPCGVTPPPEPDPNIAPAGTLTATCSLSGKTFAIQALAKVVDDDGDTVTVTASARPSSSLSSVPLSPTSGVEVKGGAGSATLTGSLTTATGKDFVVSARFDDGRDSYSPPSYTVTCP